MSNQISITRALSELKLLDSRINKAINQSQFSTYTVGNKTVTGFKNNEEYENKTKANYQSVIDLIDRRNAIKSAIVVSNATTNVEIGEYVYTVAEAIERKNSIQYDKLLLRKMKQDYANSITYVDRVNDDVKNRWDKLLEVQFGKDAKNKSSESEELSKTFMQANEAKLLDPLDLKVKIEQLELEIDEFESNVDSALSESNAVTKIEIPE